MPTAADPQQDTPPGAVERGGRSRAVTAAVLILTGLIGWYASFALTLDKLAVAADPDAELGCNISLLVQCGANLTSSAGEVFGFPNPLLGVAGFVAPIAVGVALLAGARFAPWFWWLFSAGVTAGMVFVLWLITQSITSLGTLCPWCMVVWSVMFPLFWVVHLRNADAGLWGARATRPGLLTWAVPLTLACYLAVALWAQLQLDVIARL